MFIFDDDHDWLERQTGMGDWDADCASLHAQLSGWLDAYLGELGLTIAESSREDVLRQMWDCWKEHWKDAIEARHGDAGDRLQVASRIRGGRGYKGKGKLGGDPLHDIVLAKAVCQRNDDATERFTEEYAGLAIGVARRFSPKSVGHADDWWHDFFTGHLAAFDRKDGGALASYHGRCGLANWLPQVVYNYVKGIHRKAARLREQPDGDTPGSGSEGNRESEPELDAAQTDCLRLMKRFAADGLGVLDDREQTVLRAIFYDEQVQKDIAKGIGIHPGRLAHIKSGAIQRLVRAMHESAAEADLWPGFKDCLVLLLQQRSVAYFGNLLMQALKGIGEEISI